MSSSRTTLRVGLALPALFLLAGVVWATNIRAEMRTRPVPAAAADAAAPTVAVADARAVRRHAPAIRPQRVTARPLAAPVDKAPPADSAPTVPPPPPDSVVLNQLEDLYGPVPFDHKTHVRMAEMSGGCTLCHHYTPQGQAHSSCKSCHASELADENIAMPGLKGAYHRQCLSCHQEWTHDTACNSCHLPRPKAGRCSESPLPADLKAATGRMPAPVRQRDTFVYDTSHQDAPVVTFHHADHVQTFGLQCVECHRGDSCSRCHDASPTRGVAVAHRTAGEMKGSCMSCHNESNCSMCHDQAQRPRFDHTVRTGWPLEPNHADLACRQCHGEKKAFTAPTRSCHACHARHKAESAGLASSNRPMPGGDDMDCLACHGTVRDRLAHASAVHGPAAKQAGCKSCHDLSSESSPKPAVERQSDMCLRCHSRSIDCGNGRSVASMVTLLSDGENLHRPVREGRCTACHDPHASGHENLLVREFAPGLYAPFSVERYALCFGCHDARKFLSESGAGMTQFRDGERNLHTLHVNKEKGRTCTVCHDVHASRQPFRMRDTVPFGAANWALRINFEKTDGGGSCGPGCHSPKTYERRPAPRAESSISIPNAKGG